MKDHPLPIVSVSPIGARDPERPPGPAWGWTASMPPLRVTLSEGDLPWLDALRAAVQRVETVRSQESPFPPRWEEGPPPGLKVSFHDLLRVAEELAGQSPPGAALAQALRGAVPLSPPAQSILTSRGALRFGGPPLLMGILNITPDSFSDGGLYLDPGAAVERAWQLAEEGADLIDLGAESTRPGSEPISDEEELRRLLPVLKRVSPRCPVPISVDTYKARVAEVALGEGADIINDISGLTLEPTLASVVARYGAPVVLVHILGRPATMQLDPRYRWLVADVLEGLARSVAKAVEAGLPEERCLVDPGLGFGKTFAHNEELVEALPAFLAAGRPVVVGPSRKAFVRARWGESAGALAEGTAAVCRRAAALGASVLRVHDVACVRRALGKNRPEAHPSLQG